MHCCEIDLSSFCRSNFHRAERNYWSYSHCEHELKPELKDFCEDWLNRHPVFKDVFTGGHCLQVFRSFHVSPPTHATTHTRERQNLQSHTEAAV
jgi:hypothetical protein